MPKKIKNKVSADYMRYVVMQDTQQEIARLYTVIRDTREQKDHGWFFDESAYCNGTVIRALKTGDYSLVGLEKYFTIERKRNVAEFAQNILEKRFENELERMQEIPHPFIICEFTMEDIMRWPLNCGLPPHIVSKIKISKQFILKRWMDFNVKYKVKFIPAGIYGKDIASSLFKRMYELYAKANHETAS